MTSPTAPTACPGIRPLKLAHHSCGDERYRIAATADGGIWLLHTPYPEPVIQLAGTRKVLESAQAAPPPPGSLEDVLGPGAAR